MALLELPHTVGCLVCGRDNPHGLHLSSVVDTDTGFVSTSFSPSVYHIGFEGIIHGGILATVADELMVWSAIWASGKACVAAELSLRFLKKAGVDQILNVTAKVSRHRSRLLETTVELSDGVDVICVATGKYTPLREAETRSFICTFVRDTRSEQAAALLNSRNVSR